VGAVTACDIPDCDGKGERKFADSWGNGLHLCQSHYVRAVYPVSFGGTVRTSIVSSRDNDESIGGMLTKLGLK
jgi:hypothetical protein